MREQIVIWRRDWVTYEIMVSNRSVRARFARAFSSPSWWIAASACREKENNWQRNDEEHWKESHRNESESSWSYCLLTSLIVCTDAANSGSREPTRLEATIDGIMCCTIISIMHKAWVILKWRWKCQCRHWCLFNHAVKSRFKNDRSDAITIVAGLPKVQIFIQCSWNQKKRTEGERWREEERKKHDRINNSLKRTIKMPIHELTWRTSISTDPT